MTADIENANREMLTKASNVANHERRLVATCPSLPYTMLRILSSSRINPDTVRIFDNSFDLSSE